MSGIYERFRALHAAFERTESPEILREIHELEFQKRKADDAAEREQRERAAAARKAEKQQLATGNSWDAWYTAMDQRIKQWWGAESGRVKDMIAIGMSAIRKEVHKEFQHGLAETVDAFEAQNEKLREEFRVGIGRLPIAKSWDPDEVCYRGDVVIRDGAVFQALKDTGKPPAADHPDWILLARAGRDAVTPKICGTFNAHKIYARLDIVEYEGSSFIARRDAPTGVPGIPGDGWQLLCRSGRRGATGERGPRGGRGEKGEKGDTPEITGWHLERTTYRAFPVYADGRMGPELNLRSLFEQFCDEAIGAGWGPS